MTEKAKETLEQFKEQAKKIGYFFRAKAGMPLEDEERNILIQPGHIEERTRLKQIEVPVRTYLQLLYHATDFPIYKLASRKIDRYSISIDGLSRQEHIADRQPKVVQPAPSMTAVNIGQPEKDGKEKKK